MTLLFFYTVAAFGLAYIIGHSAISLGVRENISWIGRRGAPGKLAWVATWFLALIECPACFGTWTGLVVGALYPQIVPFALSWPLASLALGLYSAGTGFILGKATGLIEES